MNSQKFCVPSLIALQGNKIQCIAKSSEVIVQRKAGLVLIYGNKVISTNTWYLQAYIVCVVAKCCKLFHFVLFLVALPFPKSNVINDIHLLYFVYFGKT